MSRINLQLNIFTLKILILCLFLSTAWTMQAQNVGIGILSPSAKLHVRVDGSAGYVGGMLLEAPYMSNGSTTAFALGKNTSSANMGEIRFTYDNFSSLFNRLEFGFSSIQPNVAFTANGRVGIGTMTPSNTLHVIGDLRIEDGTQAAGKVLTSDVNGVATWQTPSAGTETDPQVASTISNCVPKWNGSALSDGLLYDNGTNVGIGTVSPAGKLHVESEGTSGYAGHIILQAPSMTAGASTVMMLGKNTTTGNQAELRYTYNGDFSLDNRYEFGFSNIQPVVSITAAERVGIGTLTPSAKLHVVGNVRIQDGTQAVGKVLTSDVNGVATWQTPAAGAETDPQVGSAISNQIPKWNGTTLTDGLITDNGTNVGIGTTSPTGKLHVQSSGTSGYAGHIILQAPSMVAGASTVMMLGKNTTTGNQAELRYTYNGEFSLDNRYEFGFSNIQPFVSITAAERVGIGTLTPSAKLHVVGNVRIQDGTQAVGKVLTSDVNGVASWQTPTAGAETDPQVGSTVSNQIPKWNGTTLTDGLITDNGTNVGIGITNPAYKLTLGGSDGVFAVDNTGTFVAKNTGGTYEPFLWPRWSDDRMIMNYGAGGLQIRDNSSTTRLQILNNGNVGIGTTNPTTKLQVAGQVSIVDGTQAVGKVLTSDANGIASWQTPPAGAETDPQVGSAISNQIPKWNGTTLTDGLITDNGTNVGIGTTSPTGKFHVESAGTTGYAGHIILRAPSMVTTSSTVLMMGKNTSTSNQGEIRYTYNGDGSGDNRFEFGFSNIQPNVIINATGRMGIGTFNPGGLLELGSDQGRKPSTSTWTITSDARVKNIDGQYAKGLNEILQLNPILYHYKNAHNKTFSPDVLAQENVGLTAQEVQEIFPEAVGTDADGTLNLNMHAIIIAQINAIKELNAKIEEQQKQINLLLKERN